MEQVLPSPDVTTLAPAPGPLTPPEPSEPDEFGRVESAVIKRSTVGSSDWWSSGWWALPSEGPVTDITCDAGTVGECAVAAASVRGHAHRLAGRPNQDAFALRWTSIDGEPVLIAVVCDGMSSAPLSALGSRRVADRFADQLCGLAAGLLSEGLGHEALQQARDRVVDGALSSEEGSPGDYETTLTFAVLAATGRRRCSFGWVGDSPIVGLRRGRWRWLSPHLRPAGDLASSATSGVFAGGKVECHYGVLDPEVALLLCSDGLGNFIGDAPRPLALGQRLGRAWRGPVDVISFVNQLSFDLPTADDDRTAVMIWPTAGPA